MAEMSEELEALNSLEEFMGELPEKLDKTPYDYNTYIRWIELLRRVGDIESMRVARTAMSSRLAVPEDVWTEWIHDERSREPEDGLDDVAKLTKLKDLFSDAVNEYASSSMWQKYIDFVKELDDSGHNSVRVAAGEVFGHSGFVLETLEQAASATKAHYRDSQAIWLQYKNQLERCIGKASENESDRNGFVDKLQTAFLERLEQPHTEIEDTFNMYSEFVTKNFADSEYESRMVYATKIVGSTRTKCSKREWLEDNVSASGGSWYGFSLYIDKLSREKQTDIQEIFCLFERALVQNYCYPEVWDEYITFVAFSSSNDSSDALRVASRAIRNCPWSGKLWAHLLSLTYACHGYQYAVDIYNSAVSTHALEHSMLEYSYIAIALISTERQEYQASKTETADAEQLLNVCNGCIDTAYKLDTSTADPLLRLERCCTFIVTTLLCDETATRKLWTRICKARSNCTEAWILSAEFEHIHGSIPNARGVYHHAAQRKLDNPERLFDVWLTFEHVFGDQSAINKAEHFINTQRHLILRRTEREAINNGTAPYAAPWAGDTEILAAAGSLKRTHSSATYDPTPNLEAAQDTTDTVSSRNSKEASSANPAAAVFVSNLPTSYKETQLIELLGGARCVDKVELLRDQDGSFRGQAKVDLKSTNALVAALDKNGFRLENQHISIHIFKKHYQSTRQVSVMVKGFSPETGNKKIENVAKAAGGFVRIRRNQQGDVAHVVMRSMGDAVRAASALNGCIVDGHTLEADIPDLPEESDVSSTKPAKVATQKQQGTAQNRTTTSLIPRKMAVPSRRPAKRVKIAKPNADILESTRKDIANEPKDGSHTSTEPSTSNKKSNDEFRQMFLKHN
ncbi:Splicing factor [Coemansia sp. RSA 1813]|nr:Splicing factor [Coemansia sp. RSA 1813]